MELCKCLHKSLESLEASCQDLFNILQRFFSVLMDSLRDFQDPSMALKDAWLFLTAVLQCVNEMSQTV